MAVKPGPTRKTNQDHDTFHDVLTTVGLRWSPDILAALGAGPLRYTDLQRTITVSSGQNVYNRPLTASLRRLQALQVLEHVAAGNDGALYRLTAAGTELAKRITDLSTWSEHHLSSIDK